MIIRIEEQELRQVPGLDGLTSYISALNLQPIHTKEETLWVKVGPDSAHVLAAARPATSTQFLKHIASFAGTPFREVPAEQWPVWMIGGRLLTRAGIPVDTQAVIPYRRTSSGYVFFWLSGMEIFLAMHPEGSYYCYERLWKNRNIMHPDQRRLRDERSWGFSRYAGGI